MTISDLVRLGDDADRRRAIRTLGKCWALARGRYAEAIGVREDSELAGKLRAEQVRGVLRVFAMSAAAQAINAGVFIVAIRGSTPASTLVAWGVGFLAVMALDRKSTRLNSSHVALSRMPSSA